ncbi:integrase [Paraburkholderia sp. BL27I4N3]|uniref:site-specific integrase n=1 Tax=Paraburkholderia sp. BL27I4N3 TaxID=1938805 RepID=UPI000E39E735|nr:site-specific integrase [Paraburkholderia sp. BL27I4N3]REE17156.1 integrase [Paraburkholderia sp. BL27I4N3]
MASIDNRSRFIVRVQNREDLERTFPYSQTKKVEQYVGDLRRQGFKPRIERADDTYFVRIRQKGYPELQRTVGSLEEAETLVNRIASQRKDGLVIDYSTAHQTTFADCIIRYMREECVRHKGFEMETYKLNGMLEDAGCARVDLRPIIDANLAAYPHLGNVTPRTPTGIKVRKGYGALAWINLPFARVKTTDIESFIRDRLEEVKPATVDREIDLLSAICRVAIKTWDLHVAKNPMDGVRRPRYFNERDRRLKTDEAARFLDATREEDRLRSIERRVEQLMTGARDAAAQLPTVYQKKAHLKAALAACRAQAETDYTHVPELETFVQFQLMTAARRGETLNLTWSNVDLDAQTAFLPETKNGRPRTLSLRTDLIELLNELPRASDYVFDVTVDDLENAWARVCARAGIEALHIHDLRHEAISRVAETGQFTLIDLQAFSGHRDVRMLLRYAHLCASRLAAKLDEAFQNAPEHKGRRRIVAGKISLGELAMARPVEGERGKGALKTNTRNDDHSPVRATNVIPLRLRTGT